MKNIALVLLAVLNTIGSYGQITLSDTIQLVVPKGITGQEIIEKILISEDESVVLFKLKDRSVLFDVVSGKELPNNKKSKSIRNEAEELFLNIVEPQYSNGKNDTIRFYDKYAIIRNDLEVQLKHENQGVMYQMTLNGLGNFNLYQCVYFQFKNLFFILPWSFGTIQNAAICIDLNRRKMIEFTGLIAEPTSIDSIDSDELLAQTKDVGDFSEHDGNTSLCVNPINPLTTFVKQNESFNPNYWLDSNFIDFRSVDNNCIIQANLNKSGIVKVSVSNSMGTSLFQHEFSLENFKHIIQFAINEEQTHCAFSFGGTSTMVQIYEIKNEQIQEKSKHILFYEYPRIQWITSSELVVSDGYEYSYLGPSEFFIIHKNGTLRQELLSNIKGLDGFSVIDENNIITASENSIVQYNLRTHSVIELIDKKLLKHVSSFIFLKDFNVIVFLNRQSNGLDIYSLNHKKNIYSLFPLINGNVFIQLPNSPYYMCSKDASKMLHYVTPSLKVIGFEQLDPVYNRPDIVLDSIGKYFGISDRGMIEEYRKSWEKRIDRLGLDKEKLGKGEIAVPSAEIVGADDIPYENNKGSVNIMVEANDSKYQLSRFNVYVNEVPIYGSLGISITQLQAHNWDTTLTVPLSYGENKIQVSVMNELGLENFKYPTYINYTPEQEVLASKTHYIGIGVNAFKDVRHNLTYCVKDVNDLAYALSDKNTVVKVITDQQVTRENILALKQYLLDSTTVNDRVIISCSSHGLLDDSLNFYLATYYVDFKHPELQGLKYEELESLLDGLPARQKLLLLDACNSGENDKSELLKTELAKKESTLKSSELLAARGVIVQLEEENKSNFKKMNELFVNVRNNTGSVIISAAGGQESALEAIEVNGEKIENGAFTYSVLEYLKTNAGNQEALTVNKLKNYVENRVEEITNGKQKPTSRQETMEVDWRVR
jgi:hypothetical protein